MTDKERIEAIMSYFHMNNVSFCNKVGLNQATLSNILSGRTNPSLPVMRNILDAFPEISPVWMFVGQGEMLAADNKTVDAANDDSNSAPNDLFSGVGQGEETDLFSGMSQVPSAPSASAGRQPSSGLRQSAAPQMPQINVSDIVTGVVSQLQKPTRKIIEVRIFFDDGTFETFSSR